MTATSTATVETLTAEVRVLMVGSRQVTLSVANQLDTANRSDVDPFGRVRLKDGLAIIGRRISTGELVKSKLWWDPGYEVWCDELPSPIVKCQKTYVRDGDSFHGSYRGRRVEIASDCIADCDVPYGQHSTKCGWTVPRESEERLRECIAEHDLDLSRRAADEGLPLIVLAGLR